MTPPRRERGAGEARNPGFRGVPAVSGGHQRSTQKEPLTWDFTRSGAGGGGGNRTRVQGFAGPCLSHSATPPGTGHSSGAASAVWTSIQPGWSVSDDGGGRVFHDLSGGTGEVGDRVDGLAVVGEQPCGGDRGQIGRAHV